MIKQLAFLTLLIAVAGCSRDLPDRVAVDSENVNNIAEAFTGGGDGDQVQEVLQEPTGWRDVRFTFRTSGDVTIPRLTAAVINKDVGVCAPGGVFPASRKLVLGNGNAVQFAAVYLDMRNFPLDNEKWVHPDYAADADATIGPFDQKNCVILNHVFAMRASQKLLIKNSDTVGHNTKSDAAPGSPNVQIAAGGETLYDPGGKAPRGGPVSVSCSAHPWMNAYFLIREDPYNGISNEEGVVELKNVPTGVDLEFRIWHELLGNVTTAPIVEYEFKKGKLNLNLEPGDAPLEINIELDAARLQGAL